MLIDGVRETWRSIKPWAPLMATLCATATIIAVLGPSFAANDGRSGAGTTPPSSTQRAGPKNCTAWGPDSSGRCAQIRHCAQRDCIVGGTGKTFCFLVTSTECRKREATRSR